jgi:D-glycero-alpha-D-manno-heptose-7-phosphate kinase
MREIRKHADEAASHIENGDLDSLGAILNQTWISKRGVSSMVTNTQIDDLYERVISSGALGAKLLGAGNGGFLLVCGNRQLRGILQRELGEGHRMFPLEIDFSGSSIIFGT